MSGHGRYRVTFHQGRAVLIEIWRDGARMGFGTPAYHGPCARCGVQIPVFVPGNDTMEVCDECEATIEEMDQA
jgi:hypothetical protein